MKVERKDLARQFRCVSCRHRFRISEPPEGAGPGSEIDPLIAAAGQDTGTSSTGNPEPVPEPQRNGETHSGLASDLLPPRYLVAPEIEQQIANEWSGVSGDAARRGPNLGINPDLMRVHIGRQAVRVRPLSRDDKARRKRIRVAIVYLAGLVILIGVFAWLMARISN